MLPVVMTIAGSDNSAGAGAQADLKTMSALGVYGVTAITCVVAEVPGKVSAIQPVEPRIVAEQIRLLFEAFPIAAVKTGMLYSREIIATVCDTLEECFARGGPRPFLVVDPVMVATSGDPLLRDDAVALYRERVFPLAGIITPNLDEVRTLLGRPITSVDEMASAGRELVRTFKTAVLVKGGHLREAAAVDLLFERRKMHEFRARHVPGVSTHGTGCSYSAAIAANVGKGLPLVEAVSDAKRFVTAAIAHFLRWQVGGRTTDALHHFDPRAVGAGGPRIFPGDPPAKEV
ncbi:MAG TPA: bifunctional hydroxymethylpyrimidine kinase/phosphomethylpyrimidine kinase [Chthoniobacteraceae bacterium]|jgi:hydroxymethylpyrimidine/phosphomethylpyrimidine kinase|nr:bifunctional hydroxymethylpyrimidine kinase/phosphomethylpyrimidine kinase [Chthoniobacteraceae bacterium]